MTCKLDIKIDDLPPDFREIAEAIGLDPAIKLVQIRGGEAIYVPKVEKVYRAARDRAIRAEFNGGNHRELARKYGLTVVWVRAIVDQTAKSSTSVDTMDRQIPLF